MRKLALLLIILFPAILFSEEIGEVRRLYKEALSDFAEGKIDAAISNFTLISRSKRRNEPLFRFYIARSYYFLGEIAFLKEDFDKAILNYRIVLERFQEESIYERAFYKLGRTLIIADRLIEGIGMLEEFITKYYSNTNFVASAYYWLGKGYIKNGEEEKGISCFRKILENYPFSRYAYDAREILKTFSSIKETKMEKKEIGGFENEKSPELVKEKEREKKLLMAKEFLEKVSKLLEIKQALLEYKMEILEEISRKREGTDVR